MHVKNRAIVNRANLVKVYSGHMCCFKVLFFFKTLFPLAIFNFMEEHGEEQGTYYTAPSRAISFSTRFSVESMGRRHLPGCWPLSA